uniref:C-type lectin domain-containing protein n=1 Tax=Sarcophilus harrisii TaxID=9305 RepID=A0A7N4NZE3_SARHA
MKGISLDPAKSSFGPAPESQERGGGRAPSLSSGKPEGAPSPSRAALRTWGQGIRGSFCVLRLQRMLPLTFPELLFACLLLPGLVQGLEDPSDAPLARSSCPEGFSSFGSHCYGLIRYEETWSVAELLCQDYPSGHLVSLLSEAETRFVATMIAENGGSQKPIWIGLHDPQENRRWRWSSGGLFLFQSWDKGAPSQTNPNYCVILTQDSGEKEREKQQEFWQ